MQQRKHPRMQTIQKTTATGQSEQQKEDTQACSKRKYQMRRIHVAVHIPAIECQCALKDHPHQQEQSQRVSPATHGRFATLHHRSNEEGHAQQG